MEPTFIKEDWVFEIFPKRRALYFSIKWRGWLKCRVVLKQGVPLTKLTHKKDLVLLNLNCRYSLLQVSNFWKARELCSSVNHSFVWASYSFSVIHHPKPHHLCQTFSNFDAFLHKTQQGGASTKVTKLNNVIFIISPSLAFLVINFH